MAAITARPAMNGSDSVPHVERTANDPRQQGLHRVFISDIKEVNSSVMIVVLRLPPDDPPIRHKPGQWLDVHIPGIDQVGGFTITSPPSTAVIAPLNTHPFIELAIQDTPNPPAKFLSQPLKNIRNTILQVRVGGSFIWPPPQLSKPEVTSIKRAVFIAGGIGINPFMSMLSYISEEEKWPPIVRVIYTIRRNPSQHDLSSILFFNRLNGLVRDGKSYDEVDFQLRLIITDGTSDLAITNNNTPNTTTAPKPRKDSGFSETDGEDASSAKAPVYANITYGQRLQWSEIVDAVGSTEQERKDSVVYVCGPQAMTDEIVEGLKGQSDGVGFRKEEAMEDRRVLCEKWW